MLDELLPLIEQVKSEGAVVLLKWDGERTVRTYTVVITRQDTDFVWRQDSEDIGTSLAKALADYRTRHAN